jgi:hypothetical protein
MLRTVCTVSILDKIGMLRLTLLLMVFALCACTAAATVPPEKAFAPIEPSKFKDNSAQALAMRLAINDCRAKSLIAVASIENNAPPKENIVMQTNVTVQNGSGSNAFLNGVQPYVDPDWGAQLAKARRNREIQSAIFVSCMNQAGFIQQ